MMFRTHPEQKNVKRIRHKKGSVAASFFYWKERKSKKMDRITAIKGTDLKLFDTVSQKGNIYRIVEVGDDYFKIKSTSSFKNREQRKAKTITISSYLSGISKLRKIESAPVTIGKLSDEELARI